MDIFGGHHKIRLYFEVISKHFRVFSEVKNGGYILGCYNFKFLFGLLKIIDIFLGEQ